MVTAVDCREANAFARHRRERRLSDRFSDDVAVVTGGAHTDRALGIGEETAALLAEEGATVVVADVDERMSDRTVSAIEDDGGTAVGRQL